MEATMTYSRADAPKIFKGVSREDLKWTINYLVELLDKPETTDDTKNSDEEFFKFLSSMPVSPISAEEQIKAIEENRKRQHIRTFDYGE